MESVPRYSLVCAESDVFRLKVNTVSHGLFCWFEYFIESDETVATVEVQMGTNPDENTVRWFDDVKRGIEKGTRVLKDHYRRELVGIRITITKVIAHDIETSARGCANSGASFIDMVGQSGMVRPLS